MTVWGQGGSRFEGYDYARASEPDQPEEGETWYDIDANAAFVNTGTEWREMTVTDHAQLSGITSDDHHAKTTDHTELSNVASDAHHTRYTDTEAIQATDGVIDAETVDGQHASDLEPNVNVSETNFGGTVDVPTIVFFGIEATSNANYISWEITVDGTTHGEFMQNDANKFDSGQIVDSGAIVVEASYSLNSTNHAGAAYCYEVEIL